MASDRELTLDSYQGRAMLTSLRVHIVGTGLLGQVLYPALKLNGEAGEFAELIGKAYRDHDGKVDEAYKLKLMAELGDVLWYVAACAYELGFKLNEVAEFNLHKLKGRARRGLIQGEGSDR